MSDSQLMTKERFDEKLSEIKGKVAIGLEEKRKRDKDGPPRDLHRYKIEFDCSAETFEEVKKVVAVLPTMNRVWSMSAPSEKSKEALEKWRRNHM